MSILRRILDWFGMGGNNQEPGPKGGGITNEDLLKEMANVFEARLKEESVRKRMLFPMCFNVLMHKDDYYNRKDALAMVLPEVVSEFYSIIRKNLNKYPNFIPPAKSWYFQFSPCQVDSITLEDGSDLKIEKGHITTTARLFSTAEAETDTVDMEANTRVSIKCQNSRLMGTADINWDVLVGIDMLSEGVFRYKFDKKLEEPEPIPNPHPHPHPNPVPVPAPTPIPNPISKSVIAKLTYDFEGACYKYEMREQQVFISGLVGQEKKPAVFYVKNDAIADPHVAIRFLESEAKFQIAAFGKVRLNGRTMNVGTEETPEWRDIPNKSKIFMNDVLTVRFERNV